jgi:uncharacterized membrane protein
MTDPKPPSPFWGNWLTSIPKKSVLITVGYCLLGFILIGVLAVFRLIDHTIIWKFVVAHTVILGVVAEISSRVFKAPSSAPKDTST